MIENAGGKALIGASALGNLVANACGILSGQYDEALGCLAFSKEFGKFAETEADLVLVQPFVERCKEHVRNVIQREFDSLSAMPEPSSRPAKPRCDPNLARQIRAMNRPAPEGTVAELSAKYGKSLSEIRKLKRDGKLHELESSST